jgi:hypothetical protein
MIVRPLLRRFGLLSETIIDNSPTATKKSRRSWLGFLRDVLLYIGIYVFVSGFLIGPFFWSWYGAVYGDGSKWIARFFAPLALMCDYCPPLGYVINRWVDWWILT